MMELVREYSKPYVNIFLILMLSTVFIISFSYSSNYVYESFFSEFQFEPGARIGPVSVEGLNRSEAAEKVETAVKTWHSKPPILLNWNGKEKAVYPSIFTFDIRTSVEQASSSGASRLLLKISQEALEKNTSELSGQHTVPNMDYQALQKAIQDLASSLPTENIQLNLSAYLKSEPLPSVVIHKSILPNKEKKPVDLPLFARLNGRMLKTGESLSLLSLMGKKQLSESELYSLNLAATGIYQMLLHTNFEIIERHMERSMPPYAELGYEASVIPNHWDFVFKNPNPAPYTLKMSYKDDQLEVFLEGAALPAQYQPYMLGEKEFKPKTIVHFNPSLSVEEVVSKEQGKPGYMVEVYRQEWKGGKLVGKELISEDFYPPVHRVEEWGPSAPAASEPGIHYPSSELEINQGQKNEPPLEEEERLNSSDNSQPSKTPNPVNNDKDTGWFIIK